jgi:hypothetical protein
MVGLLITVGVVAWSTTFFVVYIGRWEWNRAIVSGMVALGLLVVLSTIVVLRRLAALGERLDLELHRLARRVDAPGTPPATMPSTGATGGTRFAWLPSDPAPSGPAPSGPAPSGPAPSGPVDGRDPGVFIPVLLGTGVILSLLAWAIERVAGLVGGSTLDRRTAEVVPLDLPLSARAHVRAHDLAELTDGSTLGVTGAAPDRDDLRARRSRRVVSLLVVVALAAGTVEGLRRLTQSREGPLTRPGSTTMVVQVDTKRSLTPEAAVLSMWALCRTRVDEPGLRSVRTEGDVVTIEIDRALGTTAARRVTGCFQDVVLDYARLEVERLVPVVDEAGVEGQASDPAG